MLVSDRVSEARGGRVLELSLDALFAIVSVLLLDLLLFPIPLTVAPTCAECLSNVPRLPLIPFIGALGLSLATERDAELSHRVVRGLALGAAATTYAGLIVAAATPFRDAYFTAPYRAYALGYVGLATALATTGVIVISAQGRSLSHRRLARRIAIVGIVALLAAATRGEMLIAAIGATGGAAGLALARVGRLWPSTLSGVTPDRAGLGVAIIAVALRLIFGLQTLARTGPGYAFSLASDDGNGYYRNATGMLSDPGYVDLVLRAADGYPPLYSLFLFAIFAVTHESMAAVIVAQAVLAASACLLVYLIGRRFLSAWVGVIAAFLYATDQNLIQTQSTLTTEALFVPLLLLGLWALVQYGRQRALGWICMAAIAIALVFFTRNVLAVVIPAAIFWLLWLCPRQPLRAVGAGLLLVATLLVVASPVAIATGRTESRPRFTNQLAGLGWEYQENTPYVIENGFLVQRGINPLSDPAGSLAAVARDPLPVIGFYFEAVPQRLRYLIFSVEPGAADPLTITNPGIYPNRFGQIVDLLLIVSAIVAVGTAVWRRSWRTHSELVLLVLFTLFYVALFAFVFPPRQAFRYRVPIVPLLMIAEAAGLWLLARGVSRAWSSAR